MFKVMIKRTVPAGKEHEVSGLITELRTLASGQQGYISGETLRNTENPNQYLVISIWDSEADWKSWAASDQRKSLQSRIDALTGFETIYETYRYPHISHTV